MSNILDSAIQSVQQSKAAWCRFITGNDTGATGSHQAGFIYLSVHQVYFLMNRGKRRK